MMSKSTNYLTKYQLYTIARDKMDAEIKLVGILKRASCDQNPQQHFSHMWEPFPFVSQLWMAEENLSNNKLYLNILIQGFWCILLHTGYNQNTINGATLSQSSCAFVLQSHSWLRTQTSSDHLPAHTRCSIEHKESHQRMKVWLQ